MSHREQCRAARCRGSPQTLEDRSGARGRKQEDTLNARLLRDNLREIRPNLF